MKFIRTLAILLFPLKIFSQELPENSTTYFNISNNQKLVLNVTECSKHDQRTITIGIQQNSQKTHTLKNINQSCVDAPTGIAGFIDLENDGIAEIEVTAGCGAGPNCEKNIFKLSADRKSIFQYYTGAAMLTSSYSANI